MQTTQVNMLAPEFLANPYPTYERLRHYQPISYDPGLNAWLITRYRDVVALLKDRRLSSAMQMGRLPMDQLPYLAAFEKLAVALVDQPRYNRLRKLLYRSFTPSLLATMPRTIRRVSRSLLDTMAGLHQVDFVRDFAFPLPIWVMADLLGIPQADRYLLRSWSRTVALSLDLMATPEILLQCDQAIQEFSDYLLPLARERRREPQHDLLTMLVQTEYQGHKLSEHEIMLMCLLLLITAHETTTNLLANGLFALLKHPAQLDRLKRDLSLSVSAVEEMLRYEAPVQINLRVVTEAMDYTGHAFKPGQKVIAFLGAANRDPDVFACPHTFDINRSPNPHLGFGDGIHHYLGAPLARMQSTLAIEEFLKRYPQVQLAHPDIHYEMTLRLRSLKHLAICL